MSLSKTLLSWFAIASLPGCFGGSSVKIDPAIAKQVVVHDRWDALLKKHVDSQGRVDYRGFGQDVGALDEYLAHLAQNPISDTAQKAERLAYYINLYNAGTVRLILGHYPLGSIKDIARPWAKKRIAIGGKKVSLGTIEHKILRKMDEPRIHFAINCASFSCPVLQDRAFRAATIEVQLERAARQFVNDPKKNDLAPDAIKISKIFSWFEKDFTATGSLIDYLNRYADRPIPPNTKIGYLDYDWSLNE